MFCRKCGQEIRQGAKFCVKCGTPVTQTSEHKSAIQKEKIQKSAPKKSEIGLVIAFLCVVVIVLVAIIGLRVYFDTAADVSESRVKEDEDEDYDFRKDFDFDSIVNPEASEEATAAEEEAPAEEATAAEEETPAEEAAVEEETPAEEAAVEEEAQAEEAAVEEKPHEYRIVVKDVTWTEAYQDAKSVENGYLVNINSEEEWNTIMQLIKSEQKEECIFWLGAIRRGDSQDYFWVDAKGNSIGNSLNGNAHWLSGEPTYYDSENDIEERYVDMFYMSSENRWVWNDTPDDLISLVNYYSGRIAYIIEIENE